MDKLCIVITGMPDSGKTSFGRRILKELEGKHVVDCIDLVTHGLRKKEDIKSKIKEYFEKTGVTILIVETHPPFLFNFEDESYQTIYIHLKLEHNAWLKNDPLKKPADFLLGNIYYRDFILKCIENKDFYDGVNNTYGAICTRRRDEFSISTFDNFENAVNHVLNFIKKNIDNTFDQKKADFIEYAKKKLEYLSPDYTVFQYQSFNYGNGVSNIGMSDPLYKWDRILKLGKIPLWKKTVLDIGCNIGEIGYITALKGAKVTGLEYDQTFFEAAKFLQRFRKRPVDFIQTDFMVHEFDCKYDIVLALATLYLFYGRYSIDDVIKKIRGITKEVFVGELTYNEKNKDEVYKALKEHFGKVEFIGDSFRTDIKRKECWNTRTDLSPSRQVWHCYV